ncbi:hypothetical protein MCBG_02291 [Micromonospora sp. M42]|nr:hypothetical protein MCBG_02291 [Micromonospora sp. M42]
MTGRAASPRGNGPATGARHGRCRGRETTMALWRIRATVDDRPGYLSVLTASLALRGVNILSVQVHTTEAGAVDDFPGRRARAGHRGGAAGRRGARPGPGLLGRAQRGARAGRRADPGARARRTAGP